MKKMFLILGVVAVLTTAASIGVVYLKKKNAATAYRTAKVERGNIVQSVRATGTIQPVKLIQVGTQVNGPVRKLYVDYNDVVKEGDIVAQIDPTVFEAQLARDQANYKQSLASVDQTKARLNQASNELVRSYQLAERDMISKTELDAAIADRDSLAAQLQVVEAAVEQTAAALRLSKANLDYTTIRSPVDGVVIARNVSEGQTVVASMSAQVIFLMATDLREIQVESSVPEADIGKIHVDQPVIFTVDAYDQTFTGKVAQVRMAAATVQNVVTYPVIVRAENPDSKLFPGMTANITCEVARHADVLKAPNAALRFKPAGDTQKAPRAKSGEDGAAPGARVWIEGDAGKGPTPIHVKAGITDGSFTELLETDRIKPGQSVIVGVSENGTKDTGPVNPFTPRPRTTTTGRPPPRG